MTCACERDPRRTFCSCGRANLSALRSIEISHAATPNKPWRPSRLPRTSLNSWERGIASSPRPGGTAMPYLDDKGSPVGIKAWGETWRRKFVDEGLA